VEFVTLLFHEVFDSHKSIHLYLANQITRCHILEDGNFHNDLDENVKPHKEVDQRNSWREATLLNYNHLAGHCTSTNSKQHIIVLFIDNWTIYKEGYHSV
jgi:hypothetical protein